MKIPRKLAYLDTSVLLILIGYEKRSEDYKQILRKLMYDVKIKIPQIVLGEAMAVIQKNTSDQQEITEYVNAILHPKKSITFDSDKFPPTKTSTIERAHDLTNHIEMVNDMDSLILAQAIEDNNATYFFTTDKLLRGDAVRCYINDLQKEGIRSGTLNIPSNLIVN